MLTYERLLSFGNLIQLSVKCDVPTLTKEIKTFPFRQYNTLKPDNPREGLSITSLDGSINGIGLESLYEISVKENQVYGEMDFTTLTNVYYGSNEVRKLVDPFVEFVGRCHVLRFGMGGYFPPHRDDRGAQEQQTFRIVVPLIDCTPPWSYFILDEKIVHLQSGYAYFINTNLQHAFFSFSKQAMMVVLNIKACPESYAIVLDRILKK